MNRSRGCGRCSSVVQSDHVVAKLGFAGICVVDWWWLVGCFLNLITQSLVPMKVVS